MSEILPNSAQPPRGISQSVAVIIARISGVLYVLSVGFNSAFSQLEANLSADLRVLLRCNAGFIEEATCYIKNGLQYLIAGSLFTKRGPTYLHACWRKICFLTPAYFSGRNELTDFYDFWNGDFEPRFLAGTSLPLGKMRNMTIVILFFIPKLVANVPCD